MTGQKGPKLPGIWIRAASALVMVPLTLLAAYAGGWWFAAPVAAVGLYGTYEWNRIAGTHSLTITVIGVVAITASLVLLFRFGALQAITILAVGAAVAGGVSGFGRRSMAWPAAGLAYLGLAVLGLIWLREENGVYWVYWLFLAVWATDIGAYLAGSLIGGPKLAPRISPKKTWAGFLGGIVISTIVSTIFGVWRMLDVMPVLLVAGLVLATCSQVGDIVESMVKRRFNVKDSGRLIPGHGGVLDRIDSLVFTAPLVAAGLMVFRGVGGAFHG